MSCFCDLLQVGRIEENTGNFHYALILYVSPNFRCDVQCMSFPPFLYINPLLCWIQYHWLKYIQSNTSLSHCCMSDHYRNLPLEEQHEYINIGLGCKRDKFTGTSMTRKSYPTLKPWSKSLFAEVWNTECPPTC